MDQLSDEPRNPFTNRRTGPCIAGIHVGLIERKDGSLWALGRVDRQNVAATFDYKLPISISTDGGKTWTYSVSSFPDITSGQRLTLKRLKEGPLLLCTFTDDFAHRDAGGQVDRGKKEAEMTGLQFPQPDGTTKTGYGLVAALSFGRRRHVAGPAPGYAGLSRRKADANSNHRWRPSANRRQPW